MGTTAEEAFVEIVCATVRLLGHTEVPDRAIGFGLLEDKTFEVCIYGTIRHYDYSALRIEERRIVGKPGEYTPTSAVAPCIEALVTEYGLNPDFVYRELAVDSIYVKAKWVLVHATTLFARYAAPVPIPITRVYDE